MIIPIDKKPLCVWFGDVPGPIRGDKNLINPPITKIDNYYYLRDDKRDKENVKEIVRNENAYFNSFMQDSADLKEKLYQEIKSRKKED
jgi:oligopeptidase B